MSLRRILVVDDERSILDLCDDALRALPDAEVNLEQNSTRAAERLRNEGFNLVITDLRMPGVSGLDLLRSARHQTQTVPVVILTGFPEVQTAVETMKLGAADYLGKPFDPAQLCNIATSLLSQAVSGRKRMDLNSDCEVCCEGILTCSTLMRDIIRSIQRMAQLDVNVLVVGETGTGKELAVRAVHNLSLRHAGPFVAVNCSAIPSELIESELFGHERGAFSGASSRKLGLIESAHNGTFFLDEIHELPLHLQSKLLRVLQERKLRRVGATDEIPLDVRIVAASAVDLREMVKRHRFREDLYYRVDIARIDLPALRERKEDIPLLAKHFCNKYAQQMGRTPVELSEDTMIALQAYRWPGNVRELQNLVQRITASESTGVVGPESLPEHMMVNRTTENRTRCAGYFALRECRLNLFETKYLSALMDHHEGDISAASKEARLPRWTLYRLLKKHGLSPNTFRCPKSGLH